MTDPAPEPAPEPEGEGGPGGEGDGAAIAPPVVVLVSGLQGTGKTTLARLLARRLGCVLLSRDPLMRTLVANGLPWPGLPDAGVPPVAALGAALQTAVLVEQLTLGASAVIECVMNTEMQAAWRQRAAEHGARVVAVECVCTDRALHRSRVETRYAAGQSAITWDLVSKAPEGFRTFADPDLEADAVVPAQDNARAVLRLLDDDTLHDGRGSGP